MRRPKRLRQPLHWEFNLQRLKKAVNVKKLSAKKSTVSALMWGKNVENFANAKGARTADNTINKQRMDDNFTFMLNSCVNDSDYNNQGLNPDIFITLI
jgi:hypothetical protein